MVILNRQDLSGYHGGLHFSYHSFTMSVMIELKQAVALFLAALAKWVRRSEQKALLMQTLAGSR